MSDQLNKDSSSESHRNPADEDSSPEACYAFITIPMYLLK